MSLSPAAEIVDGLRARGWRIAVAESLTGGLLCAELVAVPGASDVLDGGVVAYRADLKHRMLGVPAELLARHGTVHPDVAARMAGGVRAALALDGVAAHVGVGTTGVAGPGPAEGHPAGTAYVGVALGDDIRVIAVAATGSRDDIRRAVVSEALTALLERLTALRGEDAPPRGDAVPPAARRAGSGNGSRFDRVTGR